MPWVHFTQRVKSAVMLPTSSSSTSFANTRGARSAREGSLHAPTRSGRNAGEGAARRRAQPGRARGSATRSHPSEGARALRARSRRSSGSARRAVPRYRVRLRDAYAVFHSHEAVRADRLFEHVVTAAEPERNALLRREPLDDPRLTDRRAIDQPQRVGGHRMRGKPIRANGHVHADADPGVEHCSPRSCLRVRETRCPSGKSVGSMFHGAPDRCESTTRMRSTPR